MGTIIIMAPGWERRIEVAARGPLWGLARDIAADTRHNLIEAGNYVTGELYRSVTARGATVSIGAGHWEYIEFGTRPHVIVSRGPWLLRNRITGQVFGRHVEHPGNREYAPLRRALYKKRSIKPSAVNEAMTLA